MSSDGLTEIITDLLRDANRRKAKGRVENVHPEQLKILDEVAKKAGNIFEAPVSQITLLDDETQTFLISRGFEINEAPTNTSFCAHTLAGQDPVFIVLDTHLDKRFSQNSYVTGEAQIRFYVGCPIVIDDQKVGTICLYDFKPRDKITREQSRLLVDLAWDAAMVLGQD